MNFYFTLFFFLFLTVSTIKAELNNNAFQMSACGLNFIHKSSIVATRSVEAGHTGQVMPVTFNITELPASCYRIEAALVYWLVSYNDEELVDGIVTVNNPQGQATQVPAVTIGNDIAKCWNEDGTISYRADIRDQISGNGNYMISTNTGNRGTDGITLIIIYRDLNANYEGHLVIRDGLMTTQYSESFYRTMSGFNVCETSSIAFAMIIASDIQANAGTSVNMLLNGSTFNFPRRFWNSEVVPTSVTLNQNTSDFGVDMTGSSDCYSWTMMGLYYRTNTCNSCPEQLDMRINTGNDISICYGSEASLTATGAASYTWTSVPAGFTSNQQTITVKPLVSTRYIVNGISADGCLEGSAAINVTVNPLPVVDLGNDIFTCSEVPTTLSPSIISGTPPYQYQWSPAQYLDSPTNATVIATVTDTTEFFVTIIDANGCTDMDTIIVNTFPLPDPVINPRGPVTICYCDSISLDAGNEGYVSYLWSNGATTRTITVRDSGYYYVIVTDTNGCMNTSIPVEVNLVTPATTISLPGRNIEATPGDTVIIPLVITESEYLDLCKVNNYRALISFNSSILAPTGITPKGTEASGRRTIEIRGSRNDLDSILTVMKYIATLGNSEKTDINIDYFNWDECPAVITSIDSTLSLTQLCYEGNNTRLYKNHGIPSKTITVRPNPVENSAVLSYSLVEKGLTKIYICNLIGNTVKILFEGNGSPGWFDMPVDLNDLASGVYLIILSTPNGTETEIMEVRK